MTGRWTAGETADAFRAAVAMARAAHAGDGATVAALWDTTRCQPALVWALALLPGLLAGQALAAAGVSADLDSILAQVAILAAADLNPQTGDPDD